MLKQPKVSTALAVQDDRTVLVTTCDGGNGVLRQFRWELDEAEPAGHMALCQRIGYATLLMLSAAHPEEFARYPRLLPPPASENEGALDIVLALIHRSVQEKTLDYVAAIDRLLQSGNGDLARTDVAENWATIRLTLVEQLGGA